MTNYPKLYNVYWGDFKYDSIRNNDMNDIFENKNRFVTDYNISNKQTGLTKFKEYIENIRSQNYEHIDHFDHIECYRTNDKKYILIVSPYIPLDEIKDKMEKFGFVQIYKLYNNSATTWIKIFDIIKDANKFYKDNTIE